MITKTFHMNRMPVVTWSWLKVNTIDTELYKTEKPLRAHGVTIVAPKGIEVRENEIAQPVEVDRADYFSAEDRNLYMEENSNVRYELQIPANHQEEEMIVITMELTKETEVLADDIVIIAGPGSKATILMKYIAQDGMQGAHCGRTRILVQENATLKLIKCQLLGNEVKQHDHIVATVKEKGNLEILQPEIGSSDIVSTTNILLEGRESTATHDILYLGQGEKNLDFSNRIEMRAQKTKSCIRAKGVLTGHSKKVFRDTLSFEKGASGSKGHEEESVLMFSPKVKNMSVPILLCQEDDVEGEHAASSGRPEEKTLFYLMSRGFSEAAAKQLLAEAYFSALLVPLPDEAIKEEILDALRKSLKEGEVS